MVKAGAGRLILLSIAALLALGGLVSIFTTFTGKAFALELLGFLFLLVLALLGFLGYGQRWGKTSFFFLFLLYIINLLLLWFYQGNLYLVLLIVSTLGLILALPLPLSKSTSMAATTRKHPSASFGEIPSMVFDEPEKTERTEHKGMTAKRESFPKSVAGRSAAVPLSSLTSTAPKKTYSPGKYVASSSSNRYHIPKCDWAKKIRPARRVWFQTVEEAQQQGYRAHSCI